jgi:universal stress protein E
MHATTPGTDRSGSTRRHTSVTYGICHDVTLRLSENLFQKSGDSNMVKQIRHILVAIRDLRQAPKNELREAGTLARASGASIELFHVIDAPDPARGFPETRTLEAVEKLRAAAMSASERRLEKFARSHALRGVSVTCTAVWDYPPHEAIVRRALKAGANLVIAATREHAVGVRLVLRNTDWELIRHCPMPLLLVKTRQAVRKPVVLAAVDPFHAHGKPVNLDSELLATAGRCAKLLHGSLHVFHAYMPLMNVQIAAGYPAPPVMLPPEIEESHGRQIARAIDRLAEKAGVRRAFRHVEMGDVASELTALTRRTHTKLVVMGAVSRSALARLFIGNTAERVLDKLSCDVLIVKPRGFRSKLTQRRPIAVLSVPPAKRRSAGMHRSQRKHLRSSALGSSAAAPAQSLPEGTNAFL